MPITLDLSFLGRSGVIATAARVVNAIDAVCAAPAGLQGVVDLPAAYAGRVLG